MPVKDRGFATLIKTDPDRQRKLASLGGKTAHKRGTAHQWDSVSASIAGRKGGIAAYNARKEREHKERVA